MLGGREGAQDCLTESILRVWRAIPVYRKEAPFSTWLYRACPLEKEKKTGELTMKKALIPLLILALLLVPVLSLAEGTMRALGSASVSISPDYAVLYLGYTGENADPSQAQSQAASAITAIIDAVREKDIDEKDIVTASMYIYPVYTYQSDSQTLRGYSVEHMLRVTVRDIQQAGDILDTALRAGANQSHSIEYKSSQEKDVYLHALALAIEDATGKADAMAIAAGRWLGPLEQVNELTNAASFPYARQVSYGEEDAGSIGSTLMAGELEISASVELVYEIR